MFPTTGRLADESQWLLEAVADHGRNLARRHRIADAGALPLTALTAGEALFDRLDVTKTVPGGRPRPILDKEGSVPRPNFKSPMRETGSAELQSIAGTRA